MFLVEFSGVALCWSCAVLQILLLLCIQAGRLKMFPKARFLSGGEGSGEREFLYMEMGRFLFVFPSLSAGRQGRLAAIVSS